MMIAMAIFVVSIILDIELSISDANVDHFIIIRKLLSGKWWLPYCITFELGADIFIYLNFQIYLLD